MTIKSYPDPVLLCYILTLGKFSCAKKVTVNHTYPLIHISDLQFHGYMVDYLISTMI